MVTMHRRILDLPSVDHLEVDDAKQVLRVAVRERRSRRQPAELTAVAEQIARHIMPLIDDARTVAIYVSRPSEPGSLPTIERLSESGIRVLLPVLGPGLARDWGEYKGTDDLAERAPGRPAEPSGEILPSEEIAKADVVIAPALLVDHLGNRLGQGGGWYDRMLKLLPPGVPVWAVVFDDEFLEEVTLPHGDQDVAVTGVVRPSGLLRLDPVPTD